MNDVADTSDLKRAFALQLLLKHGDALQAALAACAGNRGFALFMADRWPDDLYVMQCKQELLDEHGEAFFLPSKYDLGHKLIEIAERSNFAEDKLKALKLYADLMGFIEKPGVNINNTSNVTTNKVMIVRDHGSDDDWEAKLVEQQRVLVHDALG